MNNFAAMNETYAAVRRLFVTILVNAHPPTCLSFLSYRRCTHDAHLFHRASAATVPRDQPSRSPACPATRRSCCHHRCHPDRLLPCRLRSRPSPPFRHSDLTAPPACELCAGVQQLGTVFRAPHNFFTHVDVAPGAARSRSLSARSFPAALAIVHVPRCVLRNVHNAGSAASPHRMANALVVHHAALLAASIVPFDIYAHYLRLRLQSVRALLTRVSADSQWPAPQAPARRAGLCQAMFNFLSSI